LNFTYFAVEFYPFFFGIKEFFFHGKKKAKRGLLKQEGLNEAPSKLKKPALRMPFTNTSTREIQI
jgi:hypothetical protein